MASTACIEYGGQHVRADLLAAHAGVLRKQSLAPQKSIFLHAALAAHVAAWDAYVKKIIGLAYMTAHSTASTGYVLIHSVAQGKMNEAVGKFNTPNSDNVRNLFMGWMNFDPWPSWNGIKWDGIALPSVLSVRIRLDELLKVRHSFAHGFTMPAYAWNTDASGVARLSCKNVRASSAFLKQIVLRTDAAFSQHMAIGFSISAPW